jgi:hypothetical protein
LQRQGVFTAPQWFFDFIEAFEPLLPVLNCPPFFVRQDALLKCSMRLMSSLVRILMIVNADSDEA